MLYTSIIFPLETNVPRQPAGRHETVRLPKRSLKWHELRSFGQKSGANSDTAAQPLPVAAPAPETQPPNFATSRRGSTSLSRRGVQQASERAYRTWASSVSKGISGVGVGASSDSQVPQAGGSSRAGRRAQQLSIIADLTIRSQARRSQGGANARGCISPLVDGCSSARSSSCSVRPITGPPRYGGPPSLPPLPPPPPRRIRTQRTAGRRRRTALPRTPPW